MKKSYFKISRSVLDDYKNLGFNYEGQIFKRTLSSAFFGDKKRVDILNEFEKMIFFLIEQVKNIKKTFNYTIDKDSNKIN
jgi:hypothetical protein